MPARIQGYKESQQKEGAPLRAYGVSWLHHNQLQSLVGITSRELCTETYHTHPREGTAHKICPYALFGK